MARQRKSEAQRAADAAIGRRIESARRAKGMTQAALASALEISVAAVYYYESGNSAVPARLLAALARNLDVSERQLLGNPSNLQDSFARARKSGNV